MKFFIDSADTARIGQLLCQYPVEGVTTNPTILGREKRPYAELLRELRNLLGPERILFVQVGGTEGKIRLEEAEHIRKFVGGRLVVKVPATPDGLAVTAELKRRDFTVAQTTVFSVGQAMLAAAAGADYVAPFVNRFVKAGGDGLGLVRAISELYRSQGINTQIIAASIGSAAQVCEIAAAGAQNITLPPEIFAELMHHPMTDDAVTKFDAAWREAYGEHEILDFI